jgi:hypothetical protein
MGSFRAGTQVLPMRVFGSTSTGACGLCLNCTDRNLAERKARQGFAEKSTPGRPYKTKTQDISKSGNDLLDVVWTFYEESLVSIAGYLVHRITADRARVQVVQDFQFFIEI